MARELVVPELTFPDSVEYPNFMTIDGQVFVMKRVECNVKQATDSVKGFYAQRFESYKKTYEEACHQLVVDHNRAQVEHLQKASQSNTVSVPPAMYETLLMVKNNRVCEARVVTWAPNSVLTSLNQAREFVGHDPSLLPAEWANTLLANSNKQYMIHITPPVRFMCIIVYDKYANKLRMHNQMTLHTMGYTEQCTGNATAEQVWRMDEAGFRQYFNNVNLFSPARNNVSGFDIVSGLNTTVSIKDLLTRCYIVRIEEEGTWRT